MCFINTIKLLKLIQNLFHISIIKKKKNYEFLKSISATMYNYNKKMLPNRKSHYPRELETIL